jgi:hypothetical protein
MTAIKEQNEKSERFKTLISIRNMFKEYEFGKNNKLISLYRRRI